MWIEAWKKITHWQPSTFAFWNDRICVLAFLWGYAFLIDLAEPRLQDNSVLLDSFFQNIRMKTLSKTQTRTPGIHVSREKLWEKASYTHINRSSKVDASPWKSKSSTMCRNNASAGKATAAEPWTMTEARRDSDNGGKAVRRQRHQQQQNPRRRSRRPLAL